MTATRVLSRRARRHSKSGRTLEITGVASFHGYLSVQYEVSPVPDCLLADSTWCDGPAGTAVDDRCHVLAECRCAYRVSADRTRVMATLNIGPGVQPGGGPVRAVFRPLAHTPGVDQPMCELVVELDAQDNASTSVRWVRL